MSRAADALRPRGVQGLVASDQVRRGERVAVENEEHVAGRHARSGIRRAGAAAGRGGRDHAQRQLAGGFRQHGRRVIGRPVARTSARAALGTAWHGRQVQQCATPRSGPDPASS